VEFPDLKIDALAEFFKRYLVREDVDGITMVDVQAYFIIIGLFMISFAFRSHGKRIDKHAIRTADLERTLDEVTDAVIDMKKEMSETNKNLERVIEHANYEKFYGRRD